MGIIEDTCLEIQEQVRACRGDGTAVTEWLDARDINLAEFIDVMRREAMGMEQAVMQGDVESLNLSGVMQAVFRWGYEVAVKKERANLL